MFTQVCWGCGGLGGGLMRSGAAMLMRLGGDHSSLLGMWGLGGGDEERSEEPICHTPMVKTPFARPQW